MAYDAATWDPVLVGAAQQFGVDPTLLQSIARQENVAPGHDNPLGISPHGGGPASYLGMADAQNAINHQLSVMTNPNGPYGDIRNKSIDQIAQVYSPPGAPNDPNRTNSTEASGIKAQYQRLSGRQFPVWGQENAQPQQQFPYDPNNDPFGNQQSAPTSPPPSWGDLTQSDSWQQLAPDDRVKVADQWYSSAFNHAESLGGFSVDDKKQLYDFYQNARKQINPPFDLGKTAGDTVNEIGRQFQEDSLKADAGAYRHEVQNPNVSTAEVEQLIQQANSIPGLTDAQKAQNEQTIRQGLQAKQQLIGQWADQKEQEVHQKEAEKKPDAPGLATTTGHLLATAAPALIGAPLGPAGMAMTGSLSQGNMGYEDGKEEISKWLDKNAPNLNPAEKAAKVAEGAKQISDINSGLG